MDGGKFLETSHPPKPKHRPFAPSERKVRVLRPIIEPAASCLPSLGPQILQGGAVGSEIVRDDRLGPTVLPHCFLKEFQCRLLVARLRDEALKNLAFMIHGTPKVVPLAIDLHEDLVEVPAPAAGFHPFDPPLPDLGGEHRAKPVPPISNRFVADLDTALVQQIFDIPEREGKPNIEHDRQADDLWAGFEPLERAVLGHGRTLATPLPRLKPGFSDRADRFHPLDPTLPDLRGEYQTEPMPPEAHGLAAHIDTALVKQILHVAKRKREPDVQHHRQPDDLAAGLKLLERVRLGLAETLASALPRLKPSFSDKTL